MPEEQLQEQQAKALLQQFDNVLRCLSQKKSSFFHDIPALPTREQFCRLVTLGFNEIMNFEIPAEQIAQKTLLDSNFPQLLYGLVDSLVNTLNHPYFSSAPFGVDGEASDIFGCQQKLEQLKEINNSFIDSTSSQADKIARLTKLQSMLKEILVDSTSNSQQVAASSHLKRHNVNLLQELMADAGLDYVAHLEAHKKDLGALTYEKVKESMSGYFYQMQADPLKRAFFILFISLFNAVNYDIYYSSNKKRKIDYDDYSSAANNIQNKFLTPEQQSWARQNGTLFPAP